MAGTALGAPQARFAWQAHHSEHLRLVLRGTCSTSFCAADAALGACQARFACRCSISSRRSARLVLRSRRSTRTPRLFCLEESCQWPALFCGAGAALGTPHACFAWQTQHEGAPLRAPSLSDANGHCLVLCGWRSTSDAFREVGGSPATSDAKAPPRFARQAQHLENLQLALLASRSTRSTSGSFCVAGAAFRAPSQRSAKVRRRVMPMGRLALGLRFVLLAGAALGALQSHFWVAGAALGTSQSQVTTPSIQLICTISPNAPSSNHPHITILICTSPSIQHHVHNTTSSTQHHLHNIMKHNIINTHHPHSNLSNVHYFKHFAADSILKSAMYSSAFKHFFTGFA